MSDPHPQWLKITITEYALDDLKSLANIELKNIAIEMISKLASRELRGLRLWSNSKTGDLTGCNKVYFDVSRDISPGYRIVYQNVPSDKKPEEIIIIAVGARADLTVYKNAIFRLNKLT